MIEGTLREYASFAAFQLRNATSNRITGQHRGVFNSVVSSINTRGPTPALGADSVATLVEELGPRCRCLDGVSFYYQVTFADSSIEATASKFATDATLRRIRDTVIAHGLLPNRIDPPLPILSGPRPLGVPVTAQYLTTILSNADERRYVLTHALTVDANNRAVVAHGFAVPAEYALGRAVKLALTSQPMLPSTLTRGLNIDSMLAVTVSTASGEVIYASDSVAPLYAATDSLESRLGNLHFEVAINPAAAGQLIIGGLPRSRLPEVLATAFVAVGLLGLLLFQFRRQEELGAVARRLRLGSLA